jgi:hypothetical protein
MVDFNYEFRIWYRLENQVDDDDDVRFVDLASVYQLLTNTSLIMITESDLR